MNLPELLFDFFIVFGVILFVFVYFVYSYRILNLLDHLGHSVPHPPPMMATSRVTVAFMQIFKIGIKINPKTQSEKELVLQLSKTVAAARILLVIAVICFLISYMLKTFHLV
jgi:hypothetical protein